MTPTGGDGWDGLADDIPAAPRSVLQPWVEAIAADDPLPDLRTRPTKQPAATEVWLLARACGAACLLTLDARPVLDQQTLPRVTGDRFEDQVRGALVEDIVRAVLAAAADGGFDVARIRRQEPEQVISGFVDAIVTLARMTAEHTEMSAVEVVRVCFAEADGSAPHPD